MTINPLAWIRSRFHTKDRRPRNGNRAAGRLSRRKKLLFVAVTLSAFCATLYAASVVYRSSGIYGHLQHRARGWEGRVHRADATLGFAPVPGARGFHVFQTGPKIPMRYDESGFREPMENIENTAAVRPLVLALGGSFTYGDACLAEEVYPYLVAKRLGGRCLNAGVCSYGLTQMLLTARQCIPRYQPDYVLVQYSDWLVKRAVEPFASSYYGKIPVPYLTANETDAFAVAPPVFRTTVFSLPTSPYQADSGEDPGFLSFLFRVGIPLLVHDDFKMAGYRLSRLLGVTPTPLSESDGISQCVYGQIAELCRAHGAQMLVITLGNRAAPAEPPASMKQMGLQVVRADLDLLNRLPEWRNKHYYKAYAHWRGDPPECVDLHPNPRAHTIIAESIVRAILEIESKRTDNGRAGISADELPTTESDAHPVR